MKLNYVVAVVLSMLFVACEPNGGGGSDDASSDFEGVYYVLNSGDWKSNNSSLTRYDGPTANVTQNVFEMQNGRGLGNLANDIVVYGNKMYIAVSGESTIEVTDLDAKFIKQIECNAQPRYMACAGGKVFVTYYDGYVARLDTATLEVEARTKVGRNPEQLAVVGNRLYVANSGGMDLYTEGVGADNTISVVDIASFEEVKKIEVVLNPAVVVPYENGVFVVSYGNYADIPSSLQCVNATNDEISVVDGCGNMTEFCYNKGVLYGFFSMYGETVSTTYLAYDVNSKEVETAWIKNGDLSSPYKVCLLGEYSCVTSSDYINDGDVYIYDTDGMLVKKIAAGLNPIKVVRTE